LTLLTPAHAILAGNGVDKICKYQIYRCFDVMLPAIVNDLAIHVIDLGFPFVDQVNSQ
jgi:hypothetical protein